MNLGKGFEMSIKMNYTVDNPEDNSENLLIFQNPNPVLVSLNFQPNLNAKLSFSTVSAYVTAWCFNICSQWCFSIRLSTMFQHMLQPGVSASAHSGVSA
jgi:hypothetical protein